LAIPEEIPGLSLAPKLSLQPGDLIVEDLEEEDDDGDDPDSPNRKSTWIPDGNDDDSPLEFECFPPGIGEDADASESNILVSDDEIPTTEVPSAVRVANADPSGVLPAIITDATVSEPVSGFPGIVESRPDTKPQPAKRSNPAAEARPLAQEETPDSAVGSDSDVSLPQFGEPPASAVSVPVLTGLAPAAASDSSPRIITDDDEPAEADGGFPSLMDSPASEKATPALAKPEPKPKQPSAVPKPDKADPKAPQKQSVYDSVLNSRRGRVIPNPVFQAWLSYTILLTAGLAMAIFYLFSAPTSNLESLPDVKPVEKSGKVVRNLVPEKAAMPPGHTLALNKTQRFGNIEVTPLRVTKGNLTLVGRNYVGSSRRIQQEGTVLKLWLKFKNVSQDQTIAPLDNELLFFRDARPDRKTGALANHFVCKANEKNEQGNLVLIYDHWVDGDYDIKDSHIGKELNPGEEVTISIPTQTEGWSLLEGPLIWRVHFRKGYSPQNYGVTTIFEVEFDSSAIQTESASA
jgi:hypothetical protein